MFRTITIDSSSTNCGYAVFDDGKLVKSETWKFNGTYDECKLQMIARSYMAMFVATKPDYVIIEKPFAMLKNGATASALNQIVGAIVGVATVLEIECCYMHNMTVKKLLKFKEKKESIQIAQSTYNIDYHITEHEADAINIFTAYKMQMEKANEK